MSKTIMSKTTGQDSWDHLLTELPGPSKSPPSPLENPPFPKRSLQSKTKKNTQASSEKKPDDNLSSSGSQSKSQTFFEDSKETEMPDQQVYSVSEINRVIKKQLEGQHPRLWLRGEISNFKAHSSGHHYFSLKDSKSQINGVMFKSYNSRLRFQPENGMEVIVFGKISVYEPRGQYQVFCESMEPVGAGALAQAFEQLKKKLSAQGFFDKDKKQNLPLHPREVAVITSPTGAAIQDILNILTRRSRRVQVTVIPTRVQGVEAAREIVRAIELANQVRQFEVIILGRGGGSMEDLWCFNEEEVAKAIYHSRLPVLSAIGHEIDFTIADFVADRRAPTPSAAAELVAQSEQELTEKLKFHNQSLKRICYQRIADYKKQIRLLEKGLVNPEKFLLDCSLKLDDWSQRLIQTSLRFIQNLRLKTQLKQQALKDPLFIIQKNRDRGMSLKKHLLSAMKQKTSQLKNDFQKQTHLLDSLNPLRVLDRGYGILRSGGQVIQSVQELKTQQIEVELKDGFMETRVLKTRKKEKS